jgi:hypothetical protein
LPERPLQETIRELDAKAILHGPEKPFSVPIDPTSNMLLWTNLPLLDFLPNDPGFFSVSTPWMFKNNMMKI